MTDNDLRPGHVSFWAERLSVDTQGIRRLRGGINNSVYLLPGDTESWVVKGYYNLDSESHNGLEAETQFLRYANVVAPAYVPRIFEVDGDRGCLVMEYIEGKVYKDKSNPSPPDIDCAVEFFRLLNKDLTLARQMISVKAKEGCYSLSDHFKNLEKRISAMTCDHLGSGQKARGLLVLGRLKESLKDVEDAISRSFGLSIISNEIPDGLYCISPGDFGFHNAIKSGTLGSRFIDFEYAGWDDAAKTLADFVLQPKIPIRNYESPLARSFKKDEMLKNRCIALEAILAVKWLCIILSILDMKRLDTLVENNKLVREELLDSRLERAIQYIDEVVQTKISILKDLSN